MKMIKWEMAEMLGYEPKTTFWQDFTMADCFGASAIRETYKRAFNDWKNNHIYLTELVMVLNHKIWQHYETNDVLARVYNELWDKTNEYAYERLKDEQLTYFYQTTN
jgi:hypothetical protein